MTGPRSSTGSPIDVEDAPQGLGADRHRDRLAGIDDLGAAHEAVGRVHRDRAHGVLAEMLRHFEHQRAAAVIDVQRVQDRRQLAVETDIDDRADDLGDRADLLWVVLVAMFSVLDVIRRCERGEAISCGMCARRIGIASSPAAPRNDGSVGS